HLLEKPADYARMGVQEYVAYDPHRRPLAPATAQRLFGWRLDPREGIMRPLSLRRDGSLPRHGSLWSIELDSRLVPDGYWLRLYDRSGHLRLTEAEVEARRAEAAEQRARLLAEKLRSLGFDPDQP